MIRYVYLVFSIIGAIAYMIRYCKLQPEKRIIEQKLIAALSIMLLFFNDPFYAITALVPNGFLYIFLLFRTFLSTLFVTTFIVMLLALIYIFLIRIYKENGIHEANSIRWFVIIPFVIFFGILLAGNLTFAFTSYNSPIIF